MAELMYQTLQIDDRLPMIGSPSAKAEAILKHLDR